MNRHIFTFEWYTGVCQMLNRCSGSSYFRDSKVCTLCTRYTWNCSAVKRPPLLFLRAFRQYCHALVTGGQNPETRETAREYLLALKSKCNTRALSAMIPERDEVRCVSLLLNHFLRPRSPTIPESCCCCVASGIRTRGMHFTVALNICCIL